MFDSLLIANRGEIACRVIRTARRLGLRTVAVYSDADAGALHVALADEACRIGPAPARESYLRAERIVEAATRAGAGAVHPGYGFLAENAGFAESCAAAGIVFVGPPPEAIRVMGDKDTALRTAAAAGVPILPGYHEDDQAPERLRAAAEEIGFPLMIKPVAGGGGKGMRVVRDAAGLDDALASARREAESSFGRGDLLLERYLERPRHVEVQVFADAHGNGVHLHERDCSVQRRHQKVIEEAPAPGLDDETRRAMGEVAVRAALAIGYRGAGTVEFLYDTATGAFHFMEMNTRLQVEHPVTEMITGLDLVEWQLRVAAGEPLPLGQASIPRRGHAMEVRIYAEDPEGGFLPSTGVITRLRLPADAPGVRVDTGVREGDAIGIHYDPMIAKLVVHGADRAQAAGRLRQALAGCEIAGPRTNLAFLARIAALPAFANGEVDTGIIERHAATLLPAPAPPPTDALALAVLRVLADRDARAMAPEGADPWSPWCRLPAWRLNAPGRETIELVTASGDVFAVGVTHEAGDRTLALPSGERLGAHAKLEPDDRLLARLGDRTLHARVTRLGDLLTATIGTERYPLTLRTLARAAGGRAVDQGHLRAPMPGKVIAVHVAAGESVARGQPLLVLEAMKMEHAIKAPVAGTVESVAFAVGDLVEEGVELIAIRADQAPTP